MSGLFYYLIGFCLVILFLLVKDKLKKPYTNKYLLSIKPNVQDVDKNDIRIWAWCIVLFILFVIASIWLYATWKEPSQQEMEMFRSFRKGVGY